ncbi:MAG: hypothetical protein K6F05_03265 [Succinivibrio sp.]|nr:hypothetical protein [Succinivibrio sp.]
MTDNLTHYRCPACGGTLEFNSRVQKLKCPYCDTEVDIEALKTLNSDTAAEENSELKGGTSFTEEELAKTESYECESCGGQIVVPYGTGAMSCPFCGNAQVVPKEFSGTLRPDFIVPFKLDKQQVKTQYFRHLEGKHFLPKVFRDQNHINEIRGVYVPYWLFNSQVHADLRFKCEKVQRSEDANFVYKRHLYYSVRRKGSLCFKDVPADASTKMPDDLMDSLEPFNAQEGVAYNPAYLSGYLANRYDQDYTLLLPRVQGRMFNSTVDAFSATVRGYDSVSLVEQQASFQQQTFRYGLFPVWLLTTKWQGKRFTFAMNGQTGKFVGNLPRDDRAYYQTLVLLSVIFSILGTFLAYVFLLTEE